MKKIIYVIKRIFSMNVKKMFEEIDKIHKKTNKNKISIFFDMIYCGFKYQAGYMDYQLFEMYNLNKSERKTILTRGINNSLIKEYNNKDYWYIFDQKEIFNKKFEKYLNRNWFYINDNYEDFEKFIKQKKEIIIKPTSLSCGVGVEKIKIEKNTDIKKLYNKCIKNNTLLIEEVAKQHKDIEKLHKSSVNTIRIVTLRNHYNVTSIVAALIRIGTNNEVVDNFNHGGVCCTIDIEKGIINSPAIDKKGNIYNNHPTTNVKLIGYKIPYWDKVKNLVIEASKIVPEIGLIGWDICIGPDKPSIIEANQFPGHDLYQLPPHRKNNIGILPTFNEAINKKQ